jgi:hypothetical protein
MGLTLTPLATDNFTPNANPLNPTNWVASGNTDSFGPLQASSSTAICTSTFIDCTGFYIGVAQQQNGYITVSCPTLNLESENSAGFYITLRSDNGQDNQYLGGILAPGDGTVNYFIQEILEDNDTFLAGPTNFTFTPGDTFTFAVVGNQQFFLHNGTIVLQGVNGDIGAAGYQGIDIGSEAALTDCALSNFIIGSATYTGGGGGTTGFEPSLVPEALGGLYYLNQL